MQLVSIEYKKVFHIISRILARDNMKNVINVM